MTSNAATVESSRSFRSQLANMASPRNIFQVAPPGAAQNSNVKFPVSLGTPLQKDETYALQARMTNEQGVVPHMGQAVVGPEYFDYVKDKEVITQYAQFQEWLMRQADLTTPESAEYWFGHFPWMLNKRVSEIERVAELQKQVGKIQVAGPQTEDDWKLLFAMDQKLVTVPDLPAHQLGMTSPASLASKNSYTLGMFSPMADAMYNPPGPDTRQVPWQNPTGGVQGSIVDGLKFPTTFLQYNEGVGAPVFGQNPPALPGRI